MFCWSCVRSIKMFCRVPRMKMKTRPCLSHLRRPQHLKRNHRVRKNLQPSLKPHQNRILSRSGNPSVANFVTFKIKCFNYVFKKWKLRMHVLHDEDFHESVHQQTGPYASVIFVDESSECILLLSLLCRRSSTTQRDIFVEDTRCESLVTSNSTFKRSLSTHSAKKLEGDAMNMIANHLLASLAI